MNDADILPKRRAINFSDPQQDVAAEDRAPSGFHLQSWNLMALTK